MQGISFKLVFLGVMTKTGKNSGKDYSIAKFMEPATNDVFEFFVKDEVLEKARALKQFMPAMVFIDISSFQGQPKINFVDVSQE